MAKGGRPRKQGVARTANGRIKRAETEKETMMVGLKARMRVYGVNEAVARDPRSGTQLGRMNIAGLLTDEQYNAALAYQAAHNAYQRALSSRQDYYEPKSEESGEQISYEEFCEIAKQRYAGVNKFIRSELKEWKSSVIDMVIINSILRDVRLPHFDMILKLILEQMYRFFFSETKKTYRFDKHDKTCV